MFDFLKKKLKESVEKLTKKTEGGEAAFGSERKAGTPEEEAAPVPEVPRPPEGPSEKTVKEAVEETVEEIPEPGEFETPVPEEEAVREEEHRPEPGPKRPVPEKGRPAPRPEKIRREAPVPVQEGKRPGLFGRLREKVATREISENDIEDFFSDSETGMLEANVALEVVDFLKDGLKKRLSGQQARRFGTGDFVRQAFEDSLFDVVNQGEADLEEVIRKAKSEGRPACLVFLGFNGSGKTTSVAKLAHYLKGKGHLPVIAAADTFRAASIEQLEVHGERIGVKVIKHQYGSDSAAVVFDAVKFAKTRGHDVVLADTAGRSHADKNLMDELSKVVRVNKPDLKVLVVDSLTGNDAVEQAKTFQKAAGVDAIVLTKVDVNKKGGAILSVCYAIKKPILFLGTGQEYGEMEMFEPRKFARELLE